MIRAALLVALAAALAAVEAPPAASDPAAGRAHLGVTLVDAAGLDDGAQLAVTAVAPESTFARLGVVPGDIVERLDDTPVRTVAAFAAAAAALRPGAELQVTVRRSGESLLLRGPIAELPRPRALANEADALRVEVAALGDAIERERLRTDLAETLRLLTAFQEGLPRTAAEFKKVYPKGTFKVRIDIDISSDAEAEDPAALAPAPLPAEAREPRAP